jgi:predicted nucleotide-binding protein
VLDAQQRMMMQVPRVLAEAARTAESLRGIAKLVAIADSIHEAAIRHANTILLDVVLHLQCPPAEIAEWARPRLVELGEALLAQVPPSDPPHERVRMVSQIGAAFRPRMEKMLREVELGLTHDDARDEELEWISAAAALAVIGDALPAPANAICKRAHAGLVRAKALRLMADNEAVNDCAVPREFWWAEGEQALAQDWAAGDFDTWDRYKKHHHRAFGVTFARCDIEKMLPMVSSNPQVTQSSTKIFIVHGHAGEQREAVARFLERLGMEPVILHEQANQGKTLIEKFETHADVGFAVVLLTADVFGGPSGGPQQPRARQNVVLELGYFIGRLSRARVCALKAGEVELPSDILGIVWTPFDAGWQRALANELDAAGYEIDWKKVMRR